MLIEDQVEEEQERLGGMMVEFSDKNNSRQERFSLANIPKCNTVSKISNMFEAWVYNGVSNDKETKSCKDYINNHKWHQCIQWSFMYILDCVLSFCELKRINSKYYPNLLRTVCIINYSHSYLLLFFF